MTSLPGLPLKVVVQSLNSFLAIAVDRKMRFHAEVREIHYGRVNELYPAQRRTQKILCRNDMGVIRYMITIDASFSRHLLAQKGQNRGFEVSECRMTSIVGDILRFCQRSCQASIAGSLEDEVLRRLATHSSLLRNGEGSGTYGGRRKLADWFGIENGGSCAQSVEAMTRSEALLERLRVAEHEDRSRVGL
jgi:hypothetical protein